MKIFRGGLGNMVAGDIVTGIAAATVGITFQPAGTTQYCITSVANFEGYNWYITDGVTSVKIWRYFAPTANTNPATALDQKVMINNTNYLNLEASNIGSFFSGIQIK